MALWVFLSLTQIHSLSCLLSAISSKQCHILHSTGSEVAYPIFFHKEKVEEWRWILRFKDKTNSGSSNAVPSLTGVEIEAHGHLMNSMLLSFTPHRAQLALPFLSQRGQVRRRLRRCGGVAAAPWCILGSPRRPRQWGWGQLQGPSSPRAAPPISGLFRTKAKWDFVLAVTWIIVPPYFQGGKCWEAVQLNSCSAWSCDSSWSIFIVSKLDVSECHTVKFQRCLFFLASRKNWKRRIWPS